jgi:hypothetical protein
MPNDLSDTILAKSDQLDAIDLAYPQTFTITKIRKVEIDEQKRVEISLAKFPRIWRPSTNMRRVLVQLWGKDGDAYIGRRVTLYNDESVTFGREKTGGIRISHMSHIDGPSDPAIMISRGKYGTHHVDPLIESQPVRETPTAPDPEPTTEQIAACTDLADLRAMHDASTSPERRAQIRARKAELLEFDGPNIASAVS